MNVRKKMNSENVTSRRRLRVAAATTLALLVGACASTEPASLENLGLSMEVDIQPGTDFEVVVPIDPDTSIRLVSAPPGVSAAIPEAPNGDSILLSVAVDPDTPRGAYGLALLVTRDGKEYELGWPFKVVELAGGASATEPTATTQPASLQALLTVDSPQIGDLFTSSSVLRGETSSPTVAYRLLSPGGSVVLAEGTVTAVDGGSATIVEFTNTCCIEMVLEVFQPSADGLGLTIPLAYPESG